MRTPPRPSVKRVCPTCGQDFWVWQSRIDKGVGIYCSDPCRVRTGDKNSNWRGGIGIDSRGAVWVYIPGSSDGSTKPTTVPRYRVVAAEKIGRSLLSNEIVHHIDGDVTNDTPENLEVMTQSEHCSLHTTELHREGKITTYSGPRDSSGRFISQE